MRTILTLIHLYSIEIPWWISVQDSRSKVVLILRKNMQRERGCKLFTVFQLSAFKRLKSNADAQHFLCRFIFIKKMSRNFISLNFISYLEFCTLFLKIKAIEDEIALGQIEEVIVICKDELLLVEYYYGEQSIPINFDTLLSASTSTFLADTASFCSD